MNKYINNVEITAGANLQNMNLRDANLRDAALWSTNLRGADLRNADLRDANLRDANLRDANLRNADLQGADLRGADLRNADLRNADLRSADLRGADLRGANSPQVLIISGSKHAIIAIRGDTKVSVGCERHKIAAWLAKYRRIGCLRRYSDTEVAEYGLLLRCVQEWLSC